MTDDNLTSQPHENKITLSNGMSDSILSPMKNGYHSEDMSIENNSGDDVSIPLEKSGGSQASLLGSRSQPFDASDDASVKSLKTMHGPGLWAEKVSL